MRTKMRTPLDGTKLCRKLNEFILHRRTGTISEEADDIYEEIVTFLCDFICDEYQLMENQDVL